MKRCVCCGERATISHHGVFRQELRRVARSHGIDGWQKRYKALVEDARGQMWMAWRHHAEFHNRTRALPVKKLSDEFFEFAVETLGASVAFNYITRRYEGDDPRLAALIEGEPNADAA